MTPMANAPGSIQALRNYYAQQPGLANTAAYTPPATMDMQNLQGQNAPNGLGLLNPAQLQQFKDQFAGQSIAAQLLGGDKFSQQQKALAQYLATQQNYAANNTLTQNDPAMADRMAYYNGGQMMYPARTPQAQPAYTNVSDMMKGLMQGNAGGAANAQGMTPQAAMQGPQPGMGTATPVTGGAPQPGAGSTPTSLPGGVSPQVQALTRFAGRGMYANPQPRMY